MRVTAVSKLAKIMLLSLALAGQSLAAVAPAQTSIVNTATATFFNPRLGITETVRSNTVEALVIEVPALDLSGEPELLLSRGAFAEHHFQVQNTGNSPLSVHADMDRAEENGLLSNITLHLDRDADGVIGPNDPLLTAGSAPHMALAIGEIAHLIYSFRVDVTAEVDDVAISTLAMTATSDLSGVSVTPEGQARGRVTIASAGLEIRKSVMRRSTERGDLLTYRINLQNNAEVDIEPYAAVSGDTIRIDGAPTSAVIVRDAIPLNTVFDRFGETGSLRPLYHLRGEAAQSFTSQPPSDPTQIDAVAFASSGSYPVGHSSDLDFSVFVAAEMGSVDILNTAETWFAWSGDLVRMPSNEVSVHRTLDEDGQLSFVDPASLADMDYSGMGEDARLRLVSGACNWSAEVDEVMIRVTSTLTRDMEFVRAIETGPNTGEFLTAAMPMAEMRSAVHRDGVMATRAGDRMVAFAECADIAMVDMLQIAPGGFVFHSLTNAPVQGATVQIMDENGRVMSTSQSDARGFFAPGSMPAGRYRMNVLPPAAMEFPSGQLSFPGFERNAETRSSFGESFDHPGGVMSLIDIPLDPFYGIPLTLEKAADKRRVQSGEYVTYTLTARNNMNQALIRAEISDRIPVGSTLVAGSITLDGIKQDDPDREGRRDRVFHLGDIDPLGVLELSYVLRFTPSARSGSRSNLAVLSGFQAGTGDLRMSGVAEAKVDLNTSGGVFSREATVIGSVFLDCNENGIRDHAGEPGVPGVQILTQEGLMVVTDEAGKYSLFGLRPVSHVLALQSATLPRGTEPLTTRASDMLRPSSRMVALKRGELRAEDFPLTGCGASQLAEIATRVAALSERDDADANLLGDLPLDTSRADSRSVRTEAGLPTATQMFGAEARELATDAQSLVAAAEARATARTPLETIIKDLDSGLGFLGMDDGQRVDRRSLSVRVKGPADLTMELALNGTRVDASRVGERVTWAAGNVQALEFIALRLVAGPNRLTLTGKDPFGNIRKSAEITVTAPGDADRIEIIAPAEAPAAAGTQVPVVVRVLDATGAPVRAATTVTLDARVASWDVSDIRSDQPGIQAYIDNGEATFGLMAPQITGTDTITVRSGLGSASADIRFTPDLDQRIMVGIIEGSVALGDAGDLIRTDELSAFEDTTTGLRGEVYLRGRIRGDRLLTLRYSSDRDTDDRLFRDIRADEYYPVYGDNSERGFDAQSSTNLYVKIEKGGSYMLYGDIAIDPADPGFKLGGYRDVTTGTKAHWEGDDVSVTVFAARTAQRSRIVEIAGRGISGPYDIDLDDFREGSEQVDLIVRDRDTGEIIEEENLRRLTDYLFDFFRNTVVFDVPVRQSDADGNPVFIRIAYQTEQDKAERYWLYGAEVVSDLSERTTVGARAVHSDGAPGTDQRFRIQSAFVRSQISSRETLELQGARSEDQLGAVGTALRMAYEWVGETVKLRVEAIAADEAYTPPGSSLQAGTTRLQASYERQIDPDRALTISGDRTSDDVSGTETARLAVGLRRRVDERTTTQSGFEITRDLEAARNGADDVNDIVFQKSAEWRPEAHQGVKLDFDLDLPVLRDSQGDLRIGGEYRMKSGMVFTGDMEFTFGPDGDRLRTAHLGVDYRVNGWLDGRSEITADIGTGDRRVIQGFTGKYDLGERVALRFGVEHSRTIGKDKSGLTSITLGGKWASEDGKWIGEGSIDQTFEVDGTTAYTDFGIAGELRPDLTLMARSRLALDKRGEGPDQLRHRLRLGAAYRPIGDARLNILTWYEHRLERKLQRTEDHIWSLAASYDATPDLRLNAKYAGQHRSLRPAPSSDEIAGLMQLIQGGAILEALPNRLEIALNAYHMWDDQDFATQAVGVEAGVVLDEGVTLSLGYNAARDRYPGDFSHYQDGIYARIRLKLDDGLWDMLDGLLGD